MQDERKKKRKIGIVTGPVPLGGSCERGKVPSPWEASFMGEKISWDRKGTSEVQRRVQQPACSRQNRERATQIVRVTSLHSPAQYAHLLVCTGAGC